MEKTLKEILDKTYKVNLPISGGFGQSIDDLIIIEVDDLQGVSVEYTVVDLIQQLGMKEYRLVKQELIVKGDKRIDKLQIQLADEPKNVRNYYFDITRMNSNE